MNLRVDVSHLFNSSSNREIKGEDQTRKPDLFSICFLSKKLEQMNQ